MPAPGQSTLDGNPNATPPVTGPYRAGKDDFNGIALTNDPNFKPDASKMPTAELLNTWSAMLVMLARLCQNSTISIRYQAGSPIVDSQASAPTAVVNATFTVARTGGGAANGDITISWAAGTFPTALTQPEGNLNGTTPGGFCASMATANSIRVVTVNMAGAATDLPFTVTLN